MSYHGRHRRDHTPAPDPIDDLLVDDTLNDTGDDLDPNEPHALIGERIDPGGHRSSQRPPL